jgi:hypothetical protein
MIGTILGYSRFPIRTARWLSFLYMLILLPLQWTLVIDQSASLEEQLLSVAGRLIFSFGEFFARRPVEDPLFFISLITPVQARPATWYSNAVWAYQPYRPSVAHLPDHLSKVRRAVTTALVIGAVPLPTRASTF